MDECSYRMLIKRQENTSFMNSGIFFITEKTVLGLKCPLLWPKWWKEMGIRHELFISMTRVKVLFIRGKLYLYICDFISCMCKGLSVPVKSEH